MEFNKKYQIIPAYLTPKSKRRSGLLISPTVKFIVAHDTGNPRSTAKNNVDYYQRSCNQDEASAHIFVDDKEILECVPALTTDRPEKAWHVRYQMPEDNKRFGYNANDTAIGVEYCYGGSIDADEAYNRYVWVLAYTCYKFKLDPAKSIVGHCILDPGRKTDPVSGLKASKRTYDQLLLDVVKEYNECLSGDIKSSQSSGNLVSHPGSVTTKVVLKIRLGAPSTSVPVVRVVPPKTNLNYIGWVDDGELVGGISKWFKDGVGNYFWSGGTV